MGNEGNAAFIHVRVDENDETRLCTDELDGFCGLFTTPASYRLPLIHVPRYQVACLDSLDLPDPLPAFTCHFRGKCGEMHGALPSDSGDAFLRVAQHAGWHLLASPGRVVCA